MLHVFQNHIDMNIIQTPACASTTAYIKLTAVDFKLVCMMYSCLQYLAPLYYGVYACEDTIKNWFTKPTWKVAHMTQKQFAKKNIIHLRFAMSIYSMETHNYHMQTEQSGHSWKS
jgi:hypothetical protein